MSGDLRRDVMLQSPIKGEGDDAGHVDLTNNANWKDLGWYRFTNIYGQGSREFFREQQVQSQITHVVEVWYSKVTATINTSMRWKAGDRILQIASVYDVEEKHATIRMGLVERT